MSKYEAAHEVERIVEQCRHELAGHPPEIQGAALADLLAIWLAGHPPPMREELLRVHIDMMCQLIPVNEEMIAKRTGRGSNDA